MSLLMALGQIFQKFNFKRYTRFGALLLLIGCLVLNVLFSIYSYKLVFLKRATRDEIPTNHIRIHTTAYVKLQELMAAFVPLLEREKLEYWIDQSTLLSSALRKETLVYNFKSIQLAFI